MWIILFDVLFILHIYNGTGNNNNKKSNETGLISQRPELIIIHIGLLLTHILKTNWVFVVTQKP